MKPIDIDIRRSKDLEINVNRGSASLELGVNQGGGAGTKNYEKLNNKPQINGVELIGNKTSEDLGIVSEADLAEAIEQIGLIMPKIYFDTTEGWNSQIGLESEKDAVYVYTDHQTIDGNNLAGIKVGDGSAYVVDLPFVDDLYLRHINDADIHITNEERAFWNAKVRAYYSLTDADTLVLTTQ